MLSRLLAAALTLASAAALLRAQIPPAFQPIPGNLFQISVGADGALWGVNGQGEIFAWDDQNTAWIYVPGTLTQIAVGSRAAVFGINFSGQVYRWVPRSEWFSGHWQFIPVVAPTGPGVVATGGRINQISVGADGDAWASDEYNLYHYDPIAQTFNFALVGNSYAGYYRVHVGFDGALWSFFGSNVGKISPAAYNFQTTVLPQEPADLAVGADGDAWAYQSGVPYHYNRLTAKWDSIPSPGIWNMAVGSATNVWGLDIHGIPHLFDTATQTWTAASGASLSQISAGQNGAVWGLDSTGNIYRGETLAQAVGAFHLVSGTVAQLSVAADGNVWAVSPSQEILTYNPLTQGWTAVPGALTQIQIDAAGDIWGLNAQQQIFQYDTANQDWIYIPGELQQISVGNGAIWGINSAQQIYRLNPLTNRFDNIPGSLTQVVVASATAFGLNAQQQIYTYSVGTDQNGWFNLPGSLTQISAGSYQTLWGFNAEGSIYKANIQQDLSCFPDYCLSGNWSLIAAGLNPAAISVAGDGSVWIVDRSGDAWRFDVPTQMFVQASSGLNLTSIVAGADAAIWAIDAQGRPYQYW